MRSSAARQPQGAPGRAPLEVIEGGAGTTGTGSLGKQARRASRPPRLNAAGFCVYCFERDCRSRRCMEHHRRADWQLCTHCDGAGFDHAEGRLCSCHGGLEDMTFSVPVTRPRPARLTFAGWCIWCLERWCTSEKCIDRHARSTWGTCDGCDGTGQLEFEPCGCAYGLMETGPLRAEP